MTIMELRKLTKEEFENIAANKPFDNRFTEKDYFVTVILYLLKDLPHLFFKGGTALQKIFLNHSRLSEDVDFTVTAEVNELKTAITKILKENGFFFKITENREYQLFTRLVIHYHGFYNNDGTVFIDLNRKAKLLLPPERHNIPHFYPESIPPFDFPTIAAKEMFAEKVRATIQRNKPRDHFDVYQIIRKSLPLDLELIKEKCQEADCDFNITKMFNNGQKLKRKWDNEMDLLMSDKVSFVEVMKTLAQYFNLKAEKEKLRKK